MCDDCLSMGQEAMSAGLCEEAGKPDDYVDGSWITRDGQVLLLTEMSTTHLQNALAMLKRAKKPKDWTQPLQDELDRR